MDHGPSTSGLNQNNSNVVKDQNKTKVVDLTLDSDEEDNGPTPAKVTRKDQEVKPDISKIKIEPGLIKTEKSIQTVREVGVQTNHGLSEENSIRKRLQNFQNNVHKLLKMIVPDEDLGKPENVEDIVDAMILHNS